MSLLKNILGAFVEFKESQNPQPPDRKAPAEAALPGATTDASTTTVTIDSTNDFTNNAATTSSGSATVTEYYKHFDDLLEEANAKNPFFKGTDFKEFIDSKIDVEAITDEASRYRTAFNVLKRTGLTKERLVTTGKEYLNIVDRDIKAFESVYEQHYRSEVEHKEQLLLQKSRELQALSEKIETLNQEMKQLSQEVIESKSKLVSNKNSFVQAGENKKKEIKTELEKIDQYF